MGLELGGKEEEMVGIGLSLEFPPSILFPFFKNLEPAAHIYYWSVYWDLCNDGGSDRTGLSLSALSFYSFRTSELK